MVAPADWKEVRLGDICEFVKTIALSRSQLEADNGVGCIHYGDIHTKFNDRLDCSNVRLPMAESGMVVGVPRLKVGDLVIADASEDMTGVGKGIEILGIPEYGVVAGLHTAVLRPRVGHFATGFLGQLQHMPKFREQARVLASGLKVYGLSKTSISKITVEIPPLKEQESIAEALSDADAAIESLDALITKKRDVKQAAMQQLLTGRTRLPGFTANWKEVRLGDIGSLRGGTGFPVRFQGRKSGEVPFYKVSDMNLSGNEIQMYDSNNWISESDSRVLGAALFPKGCIVFAKVGAAVFLERKRILTRPSCIDNNMMAIIPDTSRTDVRFLHFTLQMVRFGDLVSATALPSINASGVAGISLSMPPLKEQEAISEALTVMDDELEALIAQVSKLRMVKEGMMQDLLTGKVRLV